MKLIKLIILFSIVFIQSTKAQFEVNLSSNLGNDTVKTCISTKVTFYASSTDGGLPVTGVTYSWDFDDGTQLSEIDLDTVEHIFINRKGFRVRVIAEYNGSTAYKILPVEIGLTANFLETKSDVPEGIGVCPGEEFNLFGIAKDTSWTGEFITNYVELFAYEIEFPYVYSAPIDHKEFQYNDLLSDGEMIESIGLKIEHENLSNLQIKIVCPNETEVILKDFGGYAKYLGEPVLDDDGVTGIPYWYFWTNSPEFSTINSESMNYETLPSGNYLSDNNLDGLIGCPMNGIWNVVVTDNVSPDNGFITESSLIFDEAILPDTFQYSNNYPLSTCSWNGVGSYSTNTTNGTSLVESSEIPGIYTYTFRIKDNFGCESSTSLSVEVEKAIFGMTAEEAEADGNEIAAYIGDKLSFKDSTSWAIETRWDFGDASDNKFDKNVIHYYLDEGNYRVIMKATSAKGCVDYDTAFIEMNPLDTVEMFTDKNYIFTPNGDGINDYFSVFDGDTEYQGGNEIDSVKFTYDNSVDKDAANIAKLTGRIYNRYGQVVCEWNSVEEALNGWDGTNRDNGNIYVADGLYFYVVLVELKYKNESKEFERIKKYKGMLYVVKKK